MNHCKMLFFCLHSSNAMKFSYIFTKSLQFFFRDNKKIYVTIDRSKLDRSPSYLIRSGTSVLPAMPRAFFLSLPYHKFSVTTLTDGRARCCERYFKDWNTGASAVYRFRPRQCHIFSWSRHSVRHCVASLLTRHS